MGKKGGRRHLKRKPAPSFWAIHRKEAVWTVKPNPGPHPIARSIPLTLIVRDILGLAQTQREAKAIISKGKVAVDNQIQKEGLFPSGLMDVITISAMDKWYRILPSKKGLILHPISKDESGFKLCRIEDKTILRSGNVQLNLHDGRNLMIKVSDPYKHDEDIFKTLDTVKISLPSQEVQGHLKLAEGASALTVRGKNIGRLGKIIAIERREGQKKKSALVTIEDPKGDRFQTTVDYVFVVGDTEPSISLPEAD